MTSDADFKFASIAAFDARRKAVYRIPYAEAVTRRPVGACYCDHDDKTCYEYGHWEPAEFPDNGPGESF